MKKENVEYLILVGLFPVYLALMSLSLLSGSAFSMLVLIGVCGGYLFVVLVANLVFLFLRRDRYEESEAVLDKFRQTEKGEGPKPKLLLRKPFLFLVFSYLYILLLLLSLFFLGFATMFFLRTNVCYVIPALVLSLLLSTLTTAIIGLFLPERRRSVTMDSDSQVHRLFHALFPKKKVRVIVDRGNGFSIARTPAWTTLRLGVNLLLFLDPEELDGLLRYETSVYRDPLLKKWHRLSRRIETMERLTERMTFLNFLNVLFFRFLLFVKKKTCEDFLDVKDRMEERLRDDILLSEGREKAYLFALGKRMSLDIFDGLELPNPFYKAWEDYPEDSFIRTFGQKYEYIQKNEDRFKNYLNNSPIFKKKMEHYSIAEIDLRKKDTTGEYYRQAKSVAMKLGRKHLKRWREEYEIARYRNYQAFKDILSLRFESDESLEIALRGLVAEKDGEGERASSLYEEALLKDEENVLALYHSGLLLLRKDDGRGVERVKRASDIDANYLESGLLAIDAFYRRNGLLEEKDWTDDCYIRLIEQRLDEKEKAELTSNSLMREDGLSKEGIERIVSLAVQLPCVERIKMVEQETREGVVKHHVGLLFREKTSWQERYRAFLAFYVLLDDFRLGQEPIRFFLTPLTGEKKYDVYSSFLNGKHSKVVYETEDRKNG